MQSARPARAARCSGVAPLPSRQCTVAPALTSSVMASAGPLLAASISGTIPSLLGTDKSWCVHLRSSTNSRILTSFDANVGAGEGCSQ
jgi:hypothetical protein